MLVSTFEVLLKPQFPQGVNPAFDTISRAVIQGYFLTIANVNFIPVTVSVVFTLRFTADPADLPNSFNDFITAVDIRGDNLIPPAIGAPVLVPEILSNKARFTFTIPRDTTALLIVQPDFINQPQLLQDTNFEARGYVEIFLSSLSGSDTATLLVTPQQRGTFYKDLNGATLADVGLDQIAYDLPVSNGGVFKLSNA
jgi:hypothetical protein